MTFYLSKFESMDEMLKCCYSLKAAGQYFKMVI